ncbi:MAG: AsmA family protein, partial [candidate division Zixibacteria bacterium]|nr:AsmA family protein [candidate division Zixibacteria bacterium]
MKRPMKIGLWILGIPVCLIIMAIIGVCLLFPKEKAKTMAIDRISSALNRKVVVDDISISLWGGLGIYLEGIKIANPPGSAAPDFLTAKALDIKVRLFPLLRKELQIDRLILKEPHISLHKSLAGLNNYQLGTPEWVASIPANEMLSNESKMAAVPISFEDLAIEDGRLDYNDDSSGVKLAIYGLSLKSQMNTPRKMVYDASGRIGMDSLQTIAGNIKMPPLRGMAEYHIIVDLDANTAVIPELRVVINGIGLNIKAGIPNLKTKNYLNAEISSDKIDLVNIFPFLPDSIENLISPYNIKGGLTINANVKYNKSSSSPFIYDGRVNFLDLGLSRKGI